MLPASMKILLLLVMMLAMSLTPCYGQARGDLRLINKTLPDNKIHHEATGRLEIYWNEKWGTFCGIDYVGADIACNQLGFSGRGALQHQAYRDVDNYTKNIVPKANDNVSIAIYNTTCGRDNFFNEPLYLLRCGYAEAKDAYPGCTHDDDIILSCDSYRDDHGYDSQVRLTGGSYPSSGTLEVFFNGIWGNVCNTKMNQLAADTACRQMGFTNAKSFGSTEVKSTSLVWLDGVECGAQSCECLNRCYKVSTPIPVTCASNKFVTIQCSFDLSHYYSSYFNYTAGSKYTCMYGNACNGRSVC